MPPLYMKVTSRGCRPLRRALVGEVDRQRPVEERVLLEAAVDRLEVELGGLEDLRVGPELHGRTGRGGRLALLQRAGLGGGVVLPPDEAGLVDLDVHPDGERVHDRDADAVQATGDLVGRALELAAGVQDRQRDLDAGLLELRVEVDREAAAVVGDRDATVGQQDHVDGVAVAGHGLVDGVVHDLPDQVVEAPLTGGTDVHAGTLADCLQPLQCGEGGRRVLTLLLGRSHA